MFRTLKEKGKRVSPQRRRFPHEMPSPEEFDNLVDLGIIDCFEPTRPFISATTPLVTMGSCFAQNIAGYLGAFNYDIARLDVGDRLFTPFALQQFIEDVLRDGRPVAELSHRWKLEQDQINTLRLRLRKGAVIIVTFGLSIVWFDKQNNEMVLDPTIKEKGALIRPDNDRYEMRHTSVEENYLAACAIINALRQLNPDNKIIFTLSPMPIVYSGCDYPVVVADCISKSTLRIALDQITRMLIKDVYYFPAFELLRWLAPMVAAIWFEDNYLSHIKNDWINYTLGNFQQYYCVERAPRPPVPLLTANKS